MHCTEPVWWQWIKKFSLWRCITIWYFFLFQCHLQCYVVLKQNMQKKNLNASFAAIISSLATNTHYSNLTKVFTSSVPRHFLFCYITKLDIKICYLLDCMHHFIKELWAFYFLVLSSKQQTSMCKTIHPPKLSTLVKACFTEVTDTGHIFPQGLLPIPQDKTFGLSPTCLLAN